MINSDGSLSIEQLFELRSFSDQAQKMSREQAIDFLIELKRHLMLKENSYKLFIEKSLGKDIGVDAGVR